MEIEYGNEGIPLATTFNAWRHIEISEHGIRVLYSHTTMIMSATIENMIRSSDSNSY